LTLDDLVEIYTDLSFGMLHANRAATAKHIASRRARRSEPEPSVEPDMVAES
jgi:hypothetical protein